MKTILIVDDEPTVRNPMQEFLRLSTDYIILTAIDSDQALEHFNKKQIDLMVTNINMPGMNGIELTRYVTERYDTKVIIATGMDCYQDEACDAGVIEYILKPIRFESFLKLINNILLTKGNATIENYSTAINELSSNNLHTSDYGLSQKEAGRLYRLTDSDNFSPEHTSQAMAILRWIAFLPGALLTAWLAWFVVALLNRITMVMSGLDPNSFLFKVFIEFISQAVMGAAFVYVGAKIAPFHNKKIAYALAGIGLIAAGFMLFPAIMVANYWAIWGGVSLILGCGVTAYSVFAGETNL